VQGRKNDLNLLDESELMSNINPEELILGDGAYAPRFKVKENKEEVEEEL